MAPKVKTENVSKFSKIDFATRAQALDEISKGLKNQIKYEEELLRLKQKSDKFNERDFRKHMPRIHETNDTLAAANMAQQEVDRMKRSLKSNHFHNKLQEAGNHSHFVWSAVEEAFTLRKRQSCKIVIDGEIDPTKSANSLKEFFITVPEILAEAFIGIPKVCTEKTISMSQTEIVPNNPRISPENDQ